MYEDRIYSNDMLLSSSILNNYLQWKECRSVSQIKETSVSIMKIWSRIKDVNVFHLKQGGKFCFEPVILWTSKSSIADGSVEDTSEKHLLGSLAWEEVERQSFPFIARNVVRRKWQECVLYAMLVYKYTFKIFLIFV